MYNFCSKRLFLGKIFPLTASSIPPDLVVVRSGADGGGVDEAGVPGMYHTVSETGMSKSVVESILIVQTVTSLATKMRIRVVFEK